MEIDRLHLQAVEPGREAAGSHPLVEARRGGEVWIGRSIGGISRRMKLPKFLSVYLLCDSNFRWRAFYLTIYIPSRDIPSIYMNNIFIYKVILQYILQYIHTYIYTLRLHVVPQSQDRERRDDSKEPLGNCPLIKIGGTCLPKWLLAWEN